VNHTLRALVETVLAFDDPDFPPIEVEQVERRILASFPFEDEGELGATLLAFGEMARFPALDRATRQAEQALLTGEGLESSAEIERLIAERARVDQQRFLAFVAEFGAVERFERATLAARRAYLHLWARSCLSARRRCYATLKAVVLIPAYSLPQLARAIGAPEPPDR
jgi:hypothetical protein